MDRNMFDLDIKPFLAAITTKEGRESLQNALKLLMEQKKYLADFAGTARNLKNEKEVITALKIFEDQSEGAWKFVTDFSIENKRYKLPGVQFCNGAPRYDRYIIYFRACPKR